MPLTVPPQIRVIYAECNTGPVGGDELAEFDTFYDQTQTEIGSGAVAAALADLGLSYAAGIFTAAQDVLLAITWGINVDPTPAGSSTPGVIINTPDYPASPETSAANPNTIGTWVGSRTLLLQTSEVICVRVRGFDAAYNPISYAALSIVRLI